MTLTSQGDRRTSESCCCHCPGRCAAAAGDSEAIPLVGCRPLELRCGTMPEAPTHRARRADCGAPSTPPAGQRLDEGMPDQLGEGMAGFGDVGPSAEAEAEETASVGGRQRHWPVAVAREASGGEVLGLRVEGDGGTPLRGCRERGSSRRRASCTAGTAQSRSEVARGRPPGFGAAAAWWGPLVGRPSHGLPGPAVECREESLPLDIGRRSLLGVGPWRHSAGGSPLRRAALSRHLGLERKALAGGSGPSHPG